MLQYADLPEEELDSKSGVVAGEAARISQFYSLLTSSIDVIYKFCDRIPGFNDLCKQDRELLFRFDSFLSRIPQKDDSKPRSACLELFTLRLSHRTLPNSLKLTFCNGTVLHRNQVRSTFGDWLEGITELSKSLQAIDIDASAYACLSALTLVNGTSVWGQGSCQQIIICNSFRAPRSPGAKEGGEPADQNHQLFAGPRDLQPRGPAEAAVLHQDSGQAPGATFAQPAGAPKDLLPEAGGARARATHHRAHVLLKHPVLGLRVSFYHGFPCSDECSTSDQQST